MTDWNDINSNGGKISQLVAKDSTICMTKPDMAKYLINTIQFEDNCIVMEPCKGTGSFYDNLPNNVIKQYCEIDEGIDYLQFNGQVDITLSNPPFAPRKLFWQFMQKAMATTTRQIYWLINMSSLNVFTPKRLEEMKANGWFINNFHIVSDKRWFGRYVWVKITKTNTNIINYTDKIF